MSRCSTCGEYAWTENHKCPAKWYCIHAEDFGTGVIPDADYMIEDGYKIYAPDKEKAAIKFAEKYQGENAWYPSDMQVLVMDKEEKHIWKYVVYREAVPSYSVSFYDEPECFDVVHSTEEDE